VLPILPLKASLNRGTDVDPYQYLF
jgi:hypothetical protein